MSTMDLERIPQGSVDNMPNELLQPNLEARGGSLASASHA